MEQKTPLYGRHLAAGGKLVPFAGYLLPVRYGSGIIAEHLAVRERAGLFDVSHMGELVLEGPDALQNLNRLLTNDFTNMEVGRVRYSPMCSESGGILDDLIVYRTGEERYLLVVNAAGRRRDAEWIGAHLTGDVRLRDISDEVAQLALQGPASAGILAALTGSGSIPERYYTFRDGCKAAGVDCLVSRTGYTGEDGFELYCAPAGAPALWDALLDAGAARGLIPCGLGARDTLRLEAAMPLYGHEMDEEISPLETGLAFAVKLQKEDFIGKAGILARGAARTRVGLKATGRGIIREHSPVFADGVQIGVTTSGTHCPYLGGAYAMALVDSAHARPGTTVEAEVRGRNIPAEIVPLPFYRN